jgi:hypothetical protein
MKSQALHIAKTISATVSRHLLDAGKKVAISTGMLKPKTTLENQMKMARPRRSVERENERRNCAKSRRLRRTLSQKPWVCHPLYETLLVRMQ